MEMNGTSIQFIVKMIGPNIFYKTFYNYMDNVYYIGQNSYLSKTKSF